MKGRLLIASLLLASQATAGQPGTRVCGFDNYDQCIKLQCLGDGGPAGETPCCKPPPYYPQTCKSVRLWLPTTVIYTTPDSVYGASSADSYSTTSYIAGNFLSVKLNPLWVVMFAYGYSACAPYSELTSPTKEANSTATTWARDVNRGLLQALPNIKNPALNTRSHTDDRLLGSSMSFFKRAAQDVANPGLKFSFSPYSNQCYSITNAQPSQLAAYPTGKAYRTYGEFLNQYHTNTFNSLSSTLDGARYGLPGMNALIDDSCNDAYKTWDNRPIYFVWSYYWFSIHKGQISSCS